MLSKNIVTCPWLPVDERKTEEVHGVYHAEIGENAEPDQRLED